MAATKKKFYFDVKWLIIGAILLSSFFTGCEASERSSTRICSVLSVLSDFTGFLACFLLFPILSCP